MERCEVSCQFTALQAVHPGELGWMRRKFPILYFSHMLYPRLHQQGDFMKLSTLQSTHLSTHLSTKLYIFLSFMIRKRIYKERPRKHIKDIEGNECKDLKIEHIFVRQGSSATRTSGFVNGIVSPFWPSWAGNQFTVSSPDEQSAVRVRPSITSQLTAELNSVKLPHTSHLTTIWQPFTKIQSEMSHKSM